MPTPAAPKSFWQPSRRVEGRRNPFDQSTRALSSLPGNLAGLGYDPGHSEGVEMVKQVGETGNDIWKTIFGGETLEDKRVAAGAYAAQAQANEQLAAERAQGWSKTLPWLIIGGTVLGSMVIWAAVKK